MAHRVTAPYVTLKVRDSQTGKDVMLGFYGGAPVPSNVDPESLRIHVEGGMVEQLDEPAPVEEPEAKAPAKSTPAAKK